MNDLSTISIYIAKNTCQFHIFVFECIYKGIGKRFIIITIFTGLFYKINGLREKAQNSRSKYLHPFFCLKNDKLCSSFVFQILILILIGFVSAINEDFETVQPIAKQFFTRTGPEEVS